MLSQKVYVILKAFDSKSIEKSIRSISLTAKRGGVKVIGPISLPTKILKITVNKSPHVHKDSREQFERRSFKRLSLMLKNAIVS